MTADLELFSHYMALTGTPSLDPEPGGEPGLRGKTLGLVHGSSWISLFATYFGRKILPGVKLVAAGNEAVQLNFMAAHRKGLPCPPQVNIDLFAAYASQLHQLHGVDAILITCSTMNRAAGAVRQAMSPYGVPVVQIDEAMMEAAVDRGGPVLVVATHGPTVQNTQELLRETAARSGREISFEGATVEESFHLLGRGDISGHNDLIASAIRQCLATRPIRSVVLAQLSMAVFALSYPDPLRDFGIPVFNSAETGFQRVKSLLTRAS
jgi:hypothetical protein